MKKSELIAAIREAERMGELPEYANEPPLRLLAFALLTDRVETEPHGAPSCNCRAGNGAGFHSATCAIHGKPKGAPLECRCGECLGCIHREKAEPQGALVRVTKRTRPEITIDADEPQGALPLIKCDYGDACPGHANGTDRPCGWEPQGAPRCECDAGPGDTHRFGCPVKFKARYR